MTYRSGSIPIPDSYWLVLSYDDTHFYVIGKLTVTGSEVAAEMDAARSIKGHEPYHIAQRRAHEMFPHETRILVESVSYHEYMEAQV